VTNYNKPDKYRSKLLLTTALALSAALLFFACASGKTQQQTKPHAPTLTPAATAQPPEQEDSMNANLMAWADDQTQAEQIAALYNISLVFYSDHIATFYTEQDLNEIIELGKANGWTELSIIGTVTLDES
jgi:hypothetical protein